MDKEVIFRMATAADAPAVSEVYLASRKTFLPYAPLAHSDDEVRNYVSQILIPTMEVIVPLINGKIVGMIALSQEAGTGWIEQFYMHPSVAGKGIGTQMLEMAKDRMGAPIRLYTFQANQGARRFYERHGFQAIAFGDGSDNEERCPDVLYEWQAVTTAGREEVRGA